jgi:hypothetical protein
MNSRVSDEPPVPPVLYKYYPASRLDVFVSWTARFTAPTQFNDAFDSHYTLDSKHTVADGKRMASRNKFRNSLAGCGKSLSALNIGIYHSRKSLIPRSTWDRFWLFSARTTLFPQPARHLLLDQRPG